LQAARTVAVNPFRQPRLMPARMLALPTYANGFTYLLNA
jgi:hypothetical protein